MKHTRPRPRFRLRTILLATFLIAVPLSRCQLRLLTDDNLGRGYLAGFSGLGDAGIYKFIPFERARLRPRSFIYCDRAGESHALAALFSVTTCPCCGKEWTGEHCEAQ